MEAHIDDGPMVMGKDEIYSASAYISDKLKKKKKKERARKGAE